MKFDNYETIFKKMEIHVNTILGALLNRIQNSEINKYEKAAIQNVINKILYEKEIYFKQIRACIKDIE